MRWISIAFLIGSGGMLVGCASIMSSVTGDLADGISEAVANSADLETVRDGAPAYLILLDGLIAQDPNNAGLLMSAAALNTVYAGAFVAEPEREVLMTDKAFDYAQRGACLKIKDSCVARTQPFDEFTAWVADLDDRDVDIAYQLGRAWGFWILAHVDDFGAIAELGRPKALMSRVVQLDEGHAGGGAYLALGLMESFLPAAVGWRKYRSDYRADRPAQSPARQLTTANDHRHNAASNAVQWHRKRRHPHLAVRHSSGP